MNSLKLGELRVERARPPSCESCRTRRRGQLHARPPSRDCLCHGTGHYTECETCGHELIGEDECFVLTVPCKARYDKVHGWVTDESQRICIGCLTITIADTLPELPVRDEWDEAEERSA